MCLVQGVPHVAPFWMAVYAGSDIVSDNICGQGHWEHTDYSILGDAGIAMDIGANIGWWTFTLAKAGWSVIAFEPLPPNLALMRATLCRNPDIAARVKIHPIGLGLAEDVCELISGEYNVGDGLTRCGADMELPVQAPYISRGRFNVKVLDQIVQADGIQHLDFLKIDVEGFELNVFKGGRSVLTQLRPKKIMSEVWNSAAQGDPEMQGGTAAEYLDMFRKFNYTISREPQCQDPVSEPTQGIADYWMCNKSP